MLLFSLCLVWNEWHPLLIFAKLVDISTLFSLLNIMTQLVARASNLLVSRSYLCISEHVL